MSIPVAITRPSAAIPPEATGGAVTDAFELALGVATAEDLVLVTGSLFVVAEALEYWDGLEPERYPEFEAAGSAEATLA